MRLFVAVDPAPAAVDDLWSIVSSLEVSRANAPGASTRVVPPDRWHITVVFLGDVPPERAEAAARALDRAAAGRPARAALPATLRLAGGGTFGRGRFAILWARLVGDVAALRVLSGALRRELRHDRLPFDDKPLRPHLTLARPGSRLPPSALAADVARLDAYTGPAWPLNAVHLVESTFVTAPTGVQPQYTRLHSTALT